MKEAGFSALTFASAEEFLNSGAANCSLEFMGLIPPYGVHRIAFPEAIATLNRARLRITKRGGAVGNVFHPAWVKAHHISLQDAEARD